ncbi:MAG: hypothetical protein HUJ28_09465 [Chromatiales bacterium]|nr:hypothetical protein [Chromatiales bacterium]
MPIEWRELAQVEPGSRLAEDIRGASGDLLLRADAMLHERALQMLAQRGVMQVPVHVALDSTRYAGQIAAIDAQLSHRFRHCDDSQLMRRVRESVRRQMLARLGSDA